MKRILYIIALLAGMVLFTACEGSTWKYQVTVSYRYVDKPDNVYNAVWEEVMAPNSSVKSARLDAYSNVFDDGQKLVTVLVWKYNGSAYATATRSYEREIVCCPGIKIEHVSTTVKLLSKTD